MNNITAVIPAYNEQKTIGSVIRQLRIAGIKDIIVIDDCSTDRTAHLAMKNGARVFTNTENKGHAYSLIRGLWLAKKEFIFYLDADDQIKIKSFGFNSLFDMVIGYRVHRHDKFFRKVVSAILRLVIAIRHRYWIRDANCPFKLMRRDVVRSLLPLLPPMATIPSIDLTILAHRYHHTILEYPVEHHPYVEERKGSLQSINKKSLKVFFNAFMEIIRL